MAPLNDAVIVTCVFVATATVVTANVAVKPFGAIVAVAGTLATAGLLLDSVTVPPSVAATSVIAVPADWVPPATVDGLRSSVDSCAVGGAACGVKLRVAENGPATPATLMPRTRQKCVVVGRLVVEYSDAVTVWSRTSGAVNELESSIWIWYDVALVVSLQSNVIGCGCDEALAGDTSVGAAGTAGG